MSDDFERTAGGAVLMDGNRLRDEIVARIRRVKSRDGIRYSTTIVRLYRNGDHWKESSRFGRDDIPVVRLALDQAHAWILQQTSQNRPHTVVNT